MDDQAQQVSRDRYLTGRRQDYRAQRSMRTRRGSASSPCVTRGFTLVEILVTLAIAAVLMTVGLPAFNGFIVQQRLTSEANGFAGAVAFARSESTRRGATVSLQAVGNNNDNEWGEGYCVVVGNPGDCADPLRIFDPADQATMDAQGALNGVETLSFNARGLFTLGNTGQIDLCSDDTLEDPGRQLDISVIGRLNISSLDCPD